MNCDDVKPQMKVRGVRLGSAGGMAVVSTYKDARRMGAVAAPKLVPPQLVSVDVESRMGYVTISLSDTCRKHVPLFFEIVPKNLSCLRLDPNWKRHAGQI